MCYDCILTNNRTQWAPIQRLVQTRWPQTSCFIKTWHQEVYQVISIWAPWKVYMQILPLLKPCVGWMSQWCSVSFGWLLHSDTYGPYGHLWGRADCQTIIELLHDCSQICSGWCINLCYNNKCAYIDKEKAIQIDVISYLFHIFTSVITESKWTCYLE